MNITKEQIKEWIYKNTEPMPNENMVFHDNIHLCETFERMIGDLAPKWVSVDEIKPEDDSVFYWVKLENGWIELMRLNKYTAIGGRKDYWQNLNGNDFDMNGSRFIEIIQPK